MICVVTKAGKNKLASEDAVLVGKDVVVDSCQVLDTVQSGIVCVADGVGGNAGGAVASNFVVNALRDLAIDMSIDIRSEILDINTALLEKAKQEPKFSDMATTLTGILFFKTKYQLIHVGNTRAYVLQGDYLKQLTSDHTVYNYLCSMQRYEEAELCNKNEITSCLGGGNENYAAKISVSSITKGKKYLLTSDGVHEYVSLDFLEATLIQNMAATEKCNKIIEEALKNGSNDDLSVVFIEVEEVI